MRLFGDAEEKGQALAMKADILALRTEFRADLKEAAADLKVDILRC